MSGFGITPATDYTPPTEGEFPQFIQWQADGVDLGGPDATTVNATNGVTASRGVGENCDVITLTGGITVLQDGVPFPLPATVINIGSGLTAVQDPSTGIVTITEGPRYMAWRDVPGDYTVDISDAENGISTSGTSGAQVITIPGDTGDPTIDFPSGGAVVVFQEGPASIEFVPVSGVNMLFPSARFLPISAGQFSALTLMKRAPNTWVLCGDMFFVS